MTMLFNDPIVNADPKLQQLIGRIRFDKEKQEIAIFLILMGLPEVIQPLTHIASLINGEEDEEGDFFTVTEGLLFSALFGYICCVLTGLGAMFVGIAEYFQGFGSKNISIAVSIFMQSAYILTVSSCMRVTRVASEGSSFVVGSLDSEPNTKLLAAMGVLAIISYWFGMLGSISFLLFSLAKFQEGKPEERDGNYYRGRLAFYSCILLLGGVSQLVVGIHLERTYELNGGPLPNDAFVKVAMYVVTYPSIAIAVGCTQILNGFWGILRQCGVLQAADGGAFVTSIWVGWLIQLCLQIVVQPSVLPGGTAAAVPPTVTAFAFGMNFMPAYLDYKANSLPATLDRSFYGLEEIVDDEMEEVEGRRNSSETFHDNP